MITASRKISPLLITTIFVSSCLAQQARSNPYAQLDGKDVKGSYCLRSTQHNPVHIRELTSDAPLVTNNVANGFDIKYKLSGLCGNGAGANQIQDGDRVSISPNFFLTVTRGPNMIFKEKLFANPGPNALYMKATHEDLEYFIMIMDDKVGHPTSVSKTPIDKFYWIETYSSGDVSCKAHRPDESSGNTLTNFAPWNDRQAGTCGGVPVPAQVGSGSGGQPNP